MTPQARRDKLLVQEVGGELVVYDLERHHAHRLNGIAALIWRHCDGQATIAELAALLRRELDAAAAEQVVWLTLNRLRTAGLLNEALREPGEVRRISRRQLLQRLRTTAAVPFLLPVVTTLLAPAPAQALTGPNTCQLEIVPFDCERQTCHCPREVRSEACGIRLDPGRDPVLIGYTANATSTRGQFQVKRVAPDTKAVKEGELVCSEPACTPVMRCVEVFEVQGVGRPFRLGDLNLTSRLRPFSMREMYTAELKCDECKKEMGISVIDCDLVKLCYNFAYNKAGMDFFGSPIPGERLTFRQYAAALGENGARALCEKYYQSATQCLRSFKNHCWAACVSAVLAEELYKAYVEGDRSVDFWRIFFNVLPDIEITQPVRARQIEGRAEAFGRAHVRRGLESAIAKCGPNPCCADDLFGIAQTLVEAQRTLLDSLNLRFGLGFAARVFGRDAVSEFRKQLQENMLKALENTEQTRCMADLESRFQRRE